MKRRSPWSEAVVEDLKWLWPNYTGTEIARQLKRGITRSAVIAKARRCGLARKNRKRKK